MRLKKLYALLMITIILCMPISFAQGMIINVETYGSDNVNGYARLTGDLTTVKAKVKISNEDLITEKQVKIDGIDFTKCTDEGDNVFSCEYKEQFDYMTAMSFPFTIELYEDSGIKVDEKSASITLDNVAPTVKSFEVKQIGSEVTATYKLVDTACSDESCTGKCSGFDKIEFVGIGTFELDSSLCSYTGTNVLDSVESGTHTFKVNVYDNLKNVGSYTSEPITIDKTSPDIETDSIQFIKDGKEIEYIGENGLTGVDITIYVNEKNIDTVKGDLKSLNKISRYQLRYTDISADCKDLGGVYSCTWKNIYLFPESESGTILITVKDKNGNEIVKDVGYSLKLDAVKPQIVSIETKCNGEICYVKEKNNTIVAKITESGSGLNREFRVAGETHNFVALNLGQFASKYSTEWADECVHEGDTWTCYWYNIEVTKPQNSELKVYLAAGSQDDAGNSMEGVAEKMFVVDRKAPEMVEIFEGSGSGLDYVLQGEGFNVLLKIKEDSPTTAVGLFSGVVNDGEEYEVSCSPDDENEGEYVCEWNQVGAVIPGPMQDVPYKIKLVDFAGNEQIIEDKVDVVEAEGLPKNYWRIDGDTIPRPKAISTDSLFKEQKIYFWLPLKSSVQDIKVISARLSDCEVNTGFDLNPEVIITEDGLYVSGMTALDIETDYGVINADCSLELISVINRERVSTPQVMDISLTVPLVSASLGTINDRVSDKIDAARKKTEEGLNKVFGPLEKIYDVLNKICTAVNIYTTITHAVNTVHGTIAAALSGIPGADGYGEALARINSGFNLGNRAMQIPFAKVCAILECKHSQQLLDNGLFNDLSSQGGNVNIGGLNLQATMWPSNPKDNLILSMMTGCLGGIIYNLKKMKEIECVYIDCLQNQVPKGVPMNFCEEQYGYQQCRFVYGQIFDLIPFANFVKMIGQMLQSLFHDPIALLFGVGGMICARPLHDVAGQAVDFEWRQTVGCNFLLTLTEINGLRQAFDTIRNTRSLLDEFGMSDSACPKVGIE